MSPRQAMLVSDSFENIRAMADEVAALFYGRLFSYDRSLRGMFPSDLRDQRRKLVETIALCVQHAGDLESVKPQLRELGRRHVTYGTRAEHYPVVVRALLWSLGQALEQRFDSETRQAWQALLDAICAEMQAGAAGS